MDSFAYVELVRRAKAFAPAYGYRAVPATGPALLWRHDCDMSLERALDVAAIDAEHLGVSTFFIHLHSQFYNVFEDGQRNLVREIVELGHDIGLHFDPTFYRNLTDESINERIEWETQLLEQLLEVSLSAVSFHNPTVTQVEFHESHYSGLVNCSGPKFQTDMAYCSDSNGRWNNEDGFKVLEGKQTNRLQMLTHPEWWITNAKPARFKVFDVAFARARRVLDDYDDLLDTNRRVNEAGSFAAVLDARRKLNFEYELIEFLWLRGEFDLVELMLRDLVDQDVFRRERTKSELHANKPDAFVGGFERSERLPANSNMEQSCLMLLERLLASRED